jgi:hypothetical protein
LEKKKFKIKRMMDSSALDESSDSEEKNKIASPHIEEEHSPFAMKLSDKDFSYNARSLIFKKLNE